jgi:hypothetical protein
MWVKYRNSPYPAEQEDVLDWMDFNYPWEVYYGGGLSPWGIQQALFDFAGIQTEDTFYTTPSEQRQAIADIHKGISEGHPTIVITDYGFHAKLVKGASWQQLGTYQPSIDFMTTADPWDNGPRQDTVNYWMQVVGSGDGAGTYIRALHRTGQHYSAAEELADFDSWGGTYYGEENPPEGCDQCGGDPLEDGNTLARFFGLFRHYTTALTSRVNSWLPPGSERMLVRGTPSGRAGQVEPKNRRRIVGSGRQPKHGVRREIYVPSPDVHTRDGLTQNLFAGLRQTKLGNAGGWEDLGWLLDGNRLTLSSAVRVESVSRHSDYWLLTLRADGQPYARVLLSDQGWLLSAMRTSPDDANFEPPSDAWASQIVSEAGQIAKRVRSIHMYSDLGQTVGSTDYHPLLEATLADESRLYVAEDGSVYSPAASGRHRGFLKEGIQRFDRIR